MLRSEGWTSKLYDSASEKYIYSTSLILSLLFQDKSQSGAVEDWHRLKTVKSEKHIGD